MATSWIADFLFDATGLGVLAFALNRLLRGTPSFLRGLAITSLLVIGKCFLVDVLPMMLVSKGAVAPFWILVRPRIVIAIGAGTACGYWLISRIAKMAAPR
jgi:hypothetical protein